MPERIYALRAHANNISKTKNFLRSRPARSPIRFSDDSVIPFAIHAALAGKFLQTVDTDESFDENFDQFNEKSELLHRNNQRFVFFAEMALHELSRLPFHQFALRGISAPLRLGTFRNTFLRFCAPIGTDSGDGFSL